MSNHLCDQVAPSYQLWPVTRFLQITKCNHQQWANRLWPFFRCYYRYPVTKGNLWPYLCSKLLIVTHICNHVVTMHKMWQFMWPCTKCDQWPYVTSYKSTPDVTNYQLMQVRRFEWLAVTWSHKDLSWTKYGSKFLTSKVKVCCSPFYLTTQSNFIRLKRGA